MISVKEGTYIREREKLRETEREREREGKTEKDCKRVMENRERGRRERESEGFCVN